MARNPRHPALYEVLNRSRFRDAQHKALERIVAAKEPPKQESQVLVESEVAAEPVKAEVAAKPAKPEKIWTGRPKPVRIYPDRIELCFSWQVAGISLLALVAVFLVFFRFGQMSSTKPEIKAQPSAPLRVEDIKPKPPAVVEKVSRAAIEIKPPKLIEPMGENAIVITSYDLSSHLEPVKQYFAQYGIATEIIKPARSSRYLLVTQNRFDNIDKAGTDGYEMKKKIMSVGANYKSPPGSGYESFGTKPFQDVYGMKISPQ